MKNNIAQTEIEIPQIHYTPARTIPGFSRYYATYRGDIYNHKTGKRLKPSLNGPNGYLKVSIKNDDGECKHKFVHQLVLLAFTGPKPDPNMICHHIDHCKTNNVASNLEYITQSVNLKKAVKCGNVKTLDNNTLATKQNNKVKAALTEILYSDKPNKSAIGRKYNLSIQYINQILWGKLRKQIWQDPMLAPFKPQSI